MTKNNHTQHTYQGVIGDALIRAYQEDPDVVKRPPSRRVQGLASLTSGAIAIDALSGEGATRRILLAWRHQGLSPSDWPQSLQELLHDMLRNDAWDAMSPTLSLDEIMGQAFSACTSNLGGDQPLLRMDFATSQPAPANIQLSRTEYEQVRAWAPMWPCGDDWLVVMTDLMGGTLTHRQGILKVRLDDASPPEAVLAFWSNQWWDAVSAAMHHGITPGRIGALWLECVLNHDASALCRDGDGRETGKLLVQFLALLTKNTHIMFNGAYDAPVSEVAR